MPASRLQLLASFCSELLFVWLVLVFVFTDLGWAQGLAHGLFKHLVSWLRIKDLPQSLAI